MTTCELRLKAAEIIKQRGWRQHSMGIYGGPVCLIGAFREALKSTAKNGDRVAKKSLVAAALVAMNFPHPNTELYARTGAIAWNDSLPREVGKAIVLARLRDGCVPASLVLRRRKTLPGRSARRVRGLDGDQNWKCRNTVQRRVDGEARPAD